jgi:hypothetical protein
LFTKDDNGLLLKEVEIIGPDHVDKLGDDLTTQGVNKCVLSLKYNKAIGCDVILAEAWNVFVTKDERAEILMKWFNMIIN